MDQNLWMKNLLKEDNFLKLNDRGKKKKKSNSVSKVNLFFSVFKRHLQTAPYQSSSG